MTFLDRSPIAQAFPGKNENGNLPPDKRQTGIDLPERKGNGNKNLLATAPFYVPPNLRCPLKESPQKSENFSGKRPENTSSPKTKMAGDRVAKGNLRLSVSFLIIGKIYFLNSAKKIRLHFQQ